MKYRNALAMAIHLEVQYQKTIQIYYIDRSRYLNSILYAGVDRVNGAIRTVELDVKRERQRLDPNFDFRKLMKT